jgi:hypothetical protein
MENDFVRKLNFNSILCNLQCFVDASVLPIVPPHLATVLSLIPVLWSNIVQRKHRSYCCLSTEQKENALVRKLTGKSILCNPQTSVQPFVPSIACSRLAIFEVVDLAQDYARNSPIVGLFWTASLVLLLTR